MTGAPVDVHVFERLKVRSIINAYETLSIVGSTRIRPEVTDAMRQAAERFVNLSELNRAVGRRIAELSENEAAVVTNGASAGMLLATAACIARRNPGSEGPLTLPLDAENLDVVVQRCQYSPYLPNITQMGARLVEVGYAQQRSPESLLARAIDERTAAVFYTAGRPYERFAVPLQRVVALAHAKDVPVIVDAAALLPPMGNLRAFTSAGADLVVFSGGKGLRGPQDSGFVVGKADLVQRIHAINSPVHGLGRAFKSSKEDIVGLLVALEAALAEDEDARYARLVEQAERIQGGLAGATGVETWILPDGRQGQPCPRVAVRLLPASGWRRADLIATLAAGDPGVLVGDLDEDPDAIYLNPLSLTTEEERLVVERLLGLLVRSAEERRGAPRNP